MKIPDKKYIEALKGISLKEWEMVETAINRFFGQKISESKSDIKLTDTERVITLIRSQFE